MLRPRRIPPAAALALLLPLALVGCQRAVVDAPNPLPIAAAEYDRLYDASAAVLRDHGFRVDRQDYRFGRVTTQPADSPIVLEVWQPDNTTLGQAWQSTLDHVRRRVTLFFEPVDAPADAEAGDDDLGDYTLRIEVLMERRVQPTRRLTHATGPNVFSTLADVPGEWRRRGITANYWEPVGRDAYLENRLMRDIVARAMTPAKQR